MMGIPPVSPLLFPLSLACNRAQEEECHATVVTPHCRILQRVPSLRVSLAALSVSCLLGTEFAQSRFPSSASSSPPHGEWEHARAGSDHRTLALSAGCLSGRDVLRRAQPLLCGAAVPRVRTRAPTLLTRGPCGVAISQGRETGMVLPSSSPYRDV